MRTTLRTLGLLVALTFVSIVRAADAPALPVEVSPKDANIRYVGRFDTRDEAGPRAAWSGSSMLARFSGTAVNVKLKDGKDFFQVVVDGKPTSTLQTENKTTIYCAAKDLPKGEHTLEIFKRTEAFVGPVQFLGLQLEEGQKLLPLPERPNRRIEIIGDSISCAYGNEAKAKEEHFTPDTENNYLSYGAIAARNRGAEYACIAWSGRKMWPNNTIPEIYDLAIPTDKQSKWDFATWMPDAVLINLGTNDFGQGNPDEEKWTGAYKAFIAHVRKSYPEAHIYCAVGSMMSDSWPPKNKALSTIRGYLTRMVEELTKAGDKKMHYIEFEPQDMKNGIGADWHPSVKTHQIMAAKLTEVLAKDLGWTENKR